MPSLTPLHETYCKWDHSPPSQADVLEGFAQLVIEILADIVRHTVGNVMSFIRHIIFFIVLVISRPSESLFTRKHISSLQ